LDKQARGQLAERLLCYSSADQTEVLIAHQDAAWSRFTHNAIHQNLASADVSVSIRAIVDGRTGVAHTNLLDESALKDAARRAIALAQLAPPDPVQPDLPGPARYASPPGAYAAETAAATAHMRANICQRVFAAADAGRLWSAGYAMTSVNGITIANSRGARASFEGTDAALCVKMSGADSSGYAEAYDADVSRLDASAVAALAARKAVASRAPRAVDPGEWTVVLEPSAFGELFSCIIGQFSAQAVDEGSSFLCDGLQRKYMGSNVSIWDDYAHPLAPGMPFDFEGAPTQRLEMVRSGVAHAYVTDSYWAKKCESADTGHALPAPNTLGPLPRHTVVAPGTRPIEELIADVEVGLLVSRFWYLRPVDERRTIVTGMTRDGTFLIENGEVRGGVRNLRFNQSVLEALSCCEFSNAQQRTSSYAYSTVVPAVKIERFRFTSGTNF